MSEAEKKATGNSRSGRGRRASSSGGAGQAAAAAPFRQVESAAASAWATGPSKLAAAALVLLTCACLWLYWTATPVHSAHWVWLLLPDELVRQWTGGDWRRFGILDRLPVLAMTAAILAVACLTGRLGLSLLRTDRQLTPLERLVFSSALGLSAWSLWTLAVGLAGGLHQPAWFLIPAVLILVVSAVRVFGGGKRRVDGEETQSSAIADRPPPEVDALPSRWLWLGAPLAALIVLGAMLPPWEFDVREYHLQIPKEWRQQGWIGFVPHNVYGNMPLGAEMQALLAMSIWPGKLPWWWGALVGKTVIGSTAILTALALYAAGRRFLTPAAGVAAALLYIATPWIAHVSMAGLIDGVVGFYFFTAAYATALWAQARGRAAPSLGWAAMAGFLGGSAAACKYPALVMATLPLGLAVALWPNRRRSGTLAPGFHLRAAIVFAIGASLACGPWFVKNALLAGNPVYPLAHGLFGGKQVLRADDWRRAHAVPRDQSGRSYSPAQLAQSMSQVAWRSEWINPAMTPLAVAGGVAAAVSLARRRTRWKAEQASLLLCLCGLFLTVFVVWWLFTHRIDRFWLPGLPALSLVAGAGAVAGRHVVFRVCAQCLVVGAVISGTLVAAGRGVSDNRFLVKLNDLRTDEPSVHDIPQVRTHPAHRYLNGKPGVGTVLLVGDARPFDLEVNNLYATCFDPCPLETLFRGRTRSERLAALAKRRVTHVFVYWYEIDRYRSSYGFTDYVTKELVRGELMNRQKLLRRVPLRVLTGQGVVPLPPDSAELFEVVYDPPLRESR